jgi:hypothetical protein
MRLRIINEGAEREREREAWGGRIGEEENIAIGTTSSSSSSKGKVIPVQALRVARG